jgi:hypothetical protein
MSQQPNFMPVPVFNLQQGGGNDSPFREENQPPARIVVGLRYLDYIQKKTETRIAVNDMSIQDFPGLHPTKEEALAHDACSMMFKDYFKGKLTPDEQERFRRKINKDTTETLAPGGGRGTLMGCPICVGSTGQVHPRCQLCGGEGKIIAQRFEGD